MIKNLVNSVYKTFNLAFQTVKYFFNLTPQYILPRKFYISEKIADKEQKTLFSNYWIFAALTFEIKNNKSWIKKKIGNREVLIVHENGNYYALENVCPHKNMKLCEKKSGEGTFVCPYHAWSFNPNGSLKKIPYHDRSYKFNSKQKKNTNLNNFDISVIGIFIFIKIKKNNFKIEKQFDLAIIKSLKLLSKMLQENYGEFFETRNFNWKLNFENLRDSLHPPVLHSKTLGKQVDFSDQYKDVPPIYKMLGRLPLRYASSFTKDGENKNNKVGILDDLIKPSFPNGYYNWLLFPNFHMATPDGGRSYSIEVHNPISATQTEISHYVIMNKSNDKEDIFLEEAIEHRLRGLRPVYEEDYGVCESIQGVLKFTDREQNVGCYEHYNMNIASLYRRIVRI